MKEILLYQFSLISGFILVLAYGMISLLSVSPNDKLYKGYKTTQKIMGTTLVIWSVLLLTHIVFNLRYTNDYLARSISLFSYFMLAHGFEITLHTLLDGNYFSWQKVLNIVRNCLLYLVVLALNYFFVDSHLRKISILLLSLPLFIKMCFAAYGANKRYFDVKQNIDNYYSDNTSESVEWMRNSIYIMLALGFSSVLIPYGSAKSDAIMTIIALCTLTYVIISMRNYMLSVTTVQPLTYINRTEENRGVMSKAKIKLMETALNEWTKSNKFIITGITIDDVAHDINSNRTYISEYLNKSLNLTFKNWIAFLKIEYSKNLLLQYPDYSATRIAEMVGYARSSYNKSFLKITGTSPNEWRQKNRKV